MATRKTTNSGVRRIGFRPSLVVSLTAMILALCASSLAQPYTTLHEFGGGPDDGYNPYAPVIMDPNGVLYGTTFYGGNSNTCSGVGCGEVFQLVPPAQPGGTWTHSAIYEFRDGKDGCCPYSTLTLDRKGRLYGVANSLFRLTRPAKQGAMWHYRDLYDLTNGFYPTTPLLIDGAGALYGVSQQGGNPACGSYGCGAVLQFVPTKKGPWIENVLYEFSGAADGAFPSALVMDETGTLYGVASRGGIVAPNCSGGCGTVFKLEPQPDGTWAYSVRYSFTGTHDKSPYSLVQGTDGNFYGLAVRGQYGSEVFKLTPHRRGLWTESLVHRFGTQNRPADYCGYPATYLTTGPNGVLYGAIFGDIDLYFGALFQISPATGNGKGSWTYTTLWDFNESGPGLNPNGILLGPDGALYGTLNGGDSDGGSVFQLTLPSQAPWPPVDFCY